MPIDLTRTNVESKLDRLSYGKGLDIKEDVVEFLAKSAYAHSGNEIAAKIDTACDATRVEATLGHHPDLFEWEKVDGTIYWYMDDQTAEEVM